MYIYYVCFMFVKWWGLWIDVPKFFSCIQSINTGFVYYIYEKNFEMCLWPEFDWYKVTLCGWQDIKIQLLTNLPLFWFFIHLSESRTVHAKSRCELSLKRMILDKILTEIMVMAKNFKLMITIAAQHEEQACFLVLKPMWSKRPTFVTRTILHTHTHTHIHTHTHTHTRCTRFSAHYLSGMSEWRDVWDSPPRSHFLMPSCCPVQ